jgi:hypothetical protein
MTPPHAQEHSVRFIQEATRSNSGSAFQVMPRRGSKALSYFIQGVALGVIGIVVLAAWIGSP